jgi:hypothetical protein
MTGNPILRLAAANPVPASTTVSEPEPLRLRPRTMLAGIAVAAAITAPAAAFADDIGALLGLSNQGAPVATSTIDLSRDTKMNEAMQELGFPTTLHLLGTRNGIDFYAARRPDGDYCFAIEVGAQQGGVGCDLNGTFPSPQRPVFVFPPLMHFAGFAADGVATVAGLDAGGNTVISAPVSGNLFASPEPGPFDSVVSIEALDARGNVLATWRLPGR